MHHGELGADGRRNRLVRGLDLQRTELSDRLGFVDSFVTLAADLFLLLLATSFFHLHGQKEHVKSGSIQKGTHTF